jgi:hypothetical protein
MAAAVICQLSLTGSAGASTSSATAKSATTVATGAVAPNSANELDCNGWSPKYQAVGKEAGALCTDPIKILNGKATRFADNGWYIGHDEPSVKFISSRPGSGNTMTYVMKLPRDPKASPTANGRVVDYAQLSPAPWFGLPICDPKSYPQNPCKPDSDTNSGTITDPNAAGSAFMAVLPAGLHPGVDRQHQLQRDQVVRGHDHRQPRVHLRLRDLQQQLHRAGQLRLHADQRRPGRPAEPAARQRENVHPEPSYADVPLR